jgi:nucleoside-diphosphate-sugar epimerase
MHVQVAKESDYWSGPLIPNTRHYGHSKQLADLLIDSCIKEVGLSAITLILGTTFGPGDKSDHFIPSFLRRMIGNKDELTVYGTGEEMRDFIYIDDQVRGIYLHRDVDDRMLNIGSGNLTSLRTVVTIAKETMNYEGIINYKNDIQFKRAGDIRGLSVLRAKALTGWSITPELQTLHYGISKTLEDIIKNG